MECFSSTTQDSWKSNGTSEENIEYITKSSSNFAPTFVGHYLLPDITFNGQCSIIKKKFRSLKQ